MNIPQYIESKQRDIEQLLISAGLFGVPQKIAKLITFLQDEPNGIYEISAKVADLFKVTTDIADEVDKRLFEGIIDPYYDEFVKYNEELRKLKVENRKYVTPKAETQIPSFTSHSVRGENKPPLIPLLRKVGTARANFYFSPEDEEEIKNIQRLASSGQGLGKDAMDKIYDRVAEEVVRKVGMYQ